MYILHLQKEIENKKSFYLEILLENLETTKLLFELEKIIFSLNTNLKSFLVKNNFQHKDKKEIDKKIIKK